MAQYKILQKLQGLPWETFNPEEIIFLFWGIETQFRKLIEEAKRLHSFTEKKAQGELYAQGFTFGGYNTFTGSRAHFLSYFIFDEGRIDIKAVEKKLTQGLDYYQRYVGTLRETEFLFPFLRQRQDWVGVLKKVLDQPHWEPPVFDFMKFYLKKSIELDEDEKNFSDEVLPKNFRIDEVFLRHYYGQQLLLFESLRT
jgi:hypothetical protein